MANELYRTYEVLIEETVHPDHPKRNTSNKPASWGDGSKYAALRDTNAIFQDAVCYYTILLAGLAGNATENGKLLNPLWSELCQREQSPNSDVTKVLERLAKNYPKRFAGISTLTDFCEHVFEKPTDNSFHSELIKWRKDTYRIIEQQGTEQDKEGLPMKCKDMTQFAASWASILCDPTGETEIPGNGVFDRLHRELMAQGNASSEIFIKRLCFEIKTAGKGLRNDFVQKFTEDMASCKTEQQRAKKLARKSKEYRKYLLKQRKNAQANLASAFKKGLFGKAQKLGLSTELHQQIETEYEKLATIIEQMSFPNLRFKRLRYGERDNSFEAVILRFLWLKDDPAKREIAFNDLKLYLNDASKKPEQPPSLNGKEIQMMPYAAACKTLFPLFVTSVADVPSKTRSAWWEFDASAFATAAEDVFKYKIHTQGRQKREEKLRGVLCAYESDKESKIDQEHSPSGKDLTIRGMKGDPRWKGESATGKKGIEDLLDDLAQEKEFDDYGLRRGTIGGWTELRDAFLKLEKEVKEKKQEATLDKLEKIVEDEKRDNRQGFGSDDFFKKLCEPQYHHLWSASTEYNGIADFVIHFVRYSEWKEEWGEICEKDDNGNFALKPISYTFPGEKNRHGEISYRHFDFKQQLNRRIILKLFRKKADTNGIRYDLVEEQITLSARRLKRDKVMTADGTSIEALWCPPLVLTENKPRAGKMKKGGCPDGDLIISFSLMVSDEKSSEPKPPVHLKVAIPLEWNEQKKLKEGIIRWEKGSLRGYAKKGDKDADKRKYFKWPVDLQTQINVTATNSNDDEEGVTARKLWCGDGKRQIQGFRVKESTVPEIHILSVDLGIRFSSAFSRLRIHSGLDGQGRLISPDDFIPEIRSHMYRKGTLRLQGENLKIWQKNVSGQYVLETEPYGNDGRGRFPLVRPEKGIDEIAAFKSLADRIVPIKSFSIVGADKMTYPEMGDHLIVRLRRRISRLRSLFNLRWRVIGKKEWKAGKYEDRKPEQQKEHYRVVVERLGGLAFPKTPSLEGEEELLANRQLRDALNPNQAAWKAIKSDLEVCKEPAEEKQRCQRLDAAIANWDWTSLEKELDRQLKDYFTTGSGMADLVVAVVEHCLPLRKRHWRWNSTEHRLRMEKGGTDPNHIPFIKGMRGLSIRRLEQVLRLRQLCQSYAKLEKRWSLPETGIEPLPPMKRGEGDDPCPDLLEKSNELREQRVNQTAHLILAEALGLELKNPAEVENKKSRKSEVDLHGEYKELCDPKTGNLLPRCSVIVLEDLSRYRTSQGRTHGENSWLMQWAHRAIIKKLTDIAKPFGITLMLVDPAFSSRFDSRTGLPGIRVNSVSRGFHEEMPYAAWIERTGKDGKPSDLANKVEALKQLFDANQNYRDQLLIAIDGGKQFLPVPARDELQKDFCPPNADENAAINIGLRAVAHPDRWDIFPRLRSKELSKISVQIRNRRGTFATFADGDSNKALQKQETNFSAAGNGQASETDEENLPDFFVNACNFPGLPQSEEFKPQHSKFEFTAFRRGLFLKQVQRLCEERIQKINRQRLEKWNSAKNGNRDGGRGKEDDLNYQ